LKDGREVDSVTLVGVGVGVGRCQHLLSFCWSAVLMPACIVCLTAAGTFRLGRRCY